ncbi:MAG: hypothetical protein ABR964_01260 [Tepidisphaeraceae bacterium]
MSPLHYLILVMFMTAGAAVAQAISTLGHRRGLRRLAGRWQMHFAAADRLRLADRIAEKLPVLGAANVCVMDLLFCTVEDTHQYLFTVEYGVGVVRGKHRRYRVAGFAEPVRRGAPAADFSLTVAPQELPLAAAYQYVRDALNRPGAPPRPV